MTLLIVLTAAAVGFVLTLGVKLGPRPHGALDTERTERWFVAHAPARLQRVLRYVDRRVVGGAAVGVSFAVVFGVTLAIGWTFDSIDENTGFARWDQSAADWGGSHATATSTSILELITQLGATGWLLLVMVLVGLIDAFRQRNPSVLGYLILVGVGIALLNNGLKWLVQRERPAVNQLTSYGGWSFPSGHSAAAAACWAALAFVVARHGSRRTRAFAASGAAMITISVAASRVLLGVHWLTDVIAGAVTGWGWFLLITVLYGGRIMRFGEPADRVATGSVAPAPTDQREMNAAK